MKEIRKIVNLSIEEIVIGKKALRIMRNGFNLGWLYFGNETWHYWNHDHSMYRCDVTDIDTKETCLLKAIEYISEKRAVA